MRKGFTLIETLVYVAILAIVISAVFSYFFWTVNSNIKTKAMRETLDNARRAMEIITHEIKESESIYIPTSVFGSHPSQISLETKKYLPEGEVITYIDFFLCEDKICFKKESQNAIALTSNRVKVSKLEFNQVATDLLYPSIQIELKVDYNTLADKPEYQASVELFSTASLRSF